MNNDNRSAAWGRTLGRYAWLAAFLIVRTHYYLAVVVGPRIGWR
jgi:hypothetical protein